MPPIAPATQLADYRSPELTSITSPLIYRSLAAVTCANSLSARWPSCAFASSFWRRPSPPRPGKRSARGTSATPSAARVTRARSPTPCRRSPIPTSSTREGTTTVPRAACSSRPIAGRPGSRAATDCGTRPSPASSSSTRRETTCWLGRRRGSTRRSTARRRGGSCRVRRASAGRGA